jgi:hypothetical protein
MLESIISISTGGSMSNQPMSTRDKMEQAKQLIQQKRYDEARTILRTVDHDKAYEWLDKLNEVDPPKRNTTTDAQVTTAAVVQSKSYTSSAVVVLILYFVFWVPGVIANAMFLHDAKRAEKDLGSKLPGVGMLKVLQVLFLVIPIVLAIIAGGLFIWADKVNRDRLDSYFAENEIRIKTVFKRVCLEDITYVYTEQDCDRYANSVLRARPNYIFVNLALDSYEEGNKQLFWSWMSSGDIPTTGAILYDVDRPFRR